MSKPTLADDCARIIRLLADAPIEGLSLDEIQIRTGNDGHERWSLRTINSVLCSLGNQVTHSKLRTRNGKVTKYQLRKGN